MKRATYWVLALAVMLIGPTAHASVILDLSPAAINASTSGAFNTYASQWFYEPVTLTQGAMVTGIADYTPTTTSFVGEPVFIDVYSDINLGSGDRPGSEIYHEATTLAAVDTDGIGSLQTLVRAYAAISTPISMDAGETLWFSLSGYSHANLGQSVYDPGAVPFGLNTFWESSLMGYNGTSPGDLAMRLYGTPVPEPTSITLLSIAASALLIRRQRCMQ